MGRRRKSSNAASRWAQARAAKNDAAGVRLLRSLLGDSSRDPNHDAPLGPAHDPWIGPEPVDLGPTLGEFAARRLEVFGQPKEARRRKR